MPHPFFDVKRPVVIGHRGAAGERPENTLLSFETALDRGAQILESDVHVSRDGVPILLHDPNLDRVSDGTGMADSLAWSELETLDAGYHFRPGASLEADPEAESKPGRPPFRGAGIRIASLEQAFERFPRARFNLEIKCTGDEAIRTTLDLVERFDRSDLTLLAAGEDAIMRDLRRILADHPAEPAVSASLGEIVAAISSALEGKPMPAGVMALQIPPEFAGEPLATPRLVDHAHDHGVEVHVWTVNELDEISALLDIGVDGVVTDYPGLMADWLARGR